MKLGIAAFAAAFAGLMPLGSCSKHPAPSSGGMTTYSAPSGHFVIAAPADWRVKEEPAADRVAFFGPPTGQDAYAASISVSYHPSSAEDVRTPSDYYALEAASGARAGPLRAVAWKGARAYEFKDRRAESPVDGLPAADILEETLLVPDLGGFVALMSAAPAQERDMAAAAFSAASQSLQVRSVP